MLTLMKYYVIINNLILIIYEVRKWKRPREYGEPVWEFEIGEAPKTFNPEADLLAPSGDNVSTRIFP